LTNQTVVEETADETTSQDSSPQSEEPTTEVQNTLETQVEPEETTEDVPQDADVDKTMSEEQRRAFQQMRLENKKLKEEREQRLKGENAFDVFRPKAPTGGVDINNYVDPVSGNVDWASYNQAMSTQTRSEASQTVKELLDEERARNLYPDVFANPKLEQAIAGQWFAARLQGKDVSVSELAADYAELVQQSVAKAEKKAEERGAKQALTELTVKEAAGLKAQSTTSAPARQAQSAQDEETLKVRARYGDDDALTALVGSVGWKEK
jgi:hypothetical protein